MRRLPLLIPYGVIDGSDLPYAKEWIKTEGRLYATDRKAHLMGNFGAIIKTWTWQELSAVKVTHGFGGVWFTSPINTVSSDTGFHGYNEFVALSPSTTAVAKKLVHIEGAYILSTGDDYDSWLATLSQCLALSPIIYC